MDICTVKRKKFDEKEGLILSSVLLTASDEADSSFIPKLLEKKEAIVTTQVDYSKHRYTYQRLTGKKNQIMVFREDGSAPSFEEIQPVVNLVIQYEWLQDRYRELYFHDFGDIHCYRELEQILLEVEEYFAEYSDVFPRNAFQKVKQMTRTLLAQYVCITKTMQQIEVSHDVKVLSELKVSNLQKDLTTVLEAYQQQVFSILQNLDSFQHIISYLKRHTSIWQIKWRRVYNRLNEILEEFQEELHKEGKWYEEIEIEDYLLIPNEDREKAYEILKNEKLLLKEA